MIIVLMIAINNSNNDGNMNIGNNISNTNEYSPINNINLNESIDPTSRSDSDQNLLVIFDPENESTNNVMSNAITTPIVSEENNNDFSRNTVASSFNNLIVPSSTSMPEN